MPSSREGSEMKQEFRRSSSLPTPIRIFEELNEIT